MEIKVKIRWDKPEHKEWLCPDNIKTALSSYCPNTNFTIIETNKCHNIRLPKTWKKLIGWVMVISLIGLIYLCGALSINGVRIETGNGFVMMAAIIVAIGILSIWLFIALDLVGDLEMIVKNRHAT